MTTKNDRSSINFFNIKKINSTGYNKKLANLNNRTPENKSNSNSKEKYKLFSPGKKVLNLKTNFFDYDKKNKNKENKYDNKINKSNTSLNYNTIQNKSTNFISKETITIKEVNRKIKPTLLNMADLYSPHKDFQNMINKFKIQEPNVINNLKQDNKNNTSSTSSLSPSNYNQFKATARSITPNKQIRELLLSPKLLYKNQPSTPNIKEVPRPTFENEEDLSTNSIKFLNDNSNFFKYNFSESAKKANKGAGCITSFGVNTHYGNIR